MLKFELAEASEPTVHPNETEDTYVNPQYPDLYMANGTCYVWFQFEPDESYDPPTVDLYPTALSSLKKRHWLEREVHNGGLDLIFGPERCDFGEWLNFALKEGLYLSQPFLVAFDYPDYYRCSHPLDPEEWDVNYSWEIIYRDEPTAEMIAETVKFLGEVLEQ